MGRWGEGNDLDFWTALERGEVDDAEIRAVDLLRRTTDPFRFAYYCQTAMLPTMGNITGRIYMVERGGGALELEDGQLNASWCISIGPHSRSIPGTDQVVVLRNFIEGEEIEFMRIGNRAEFGLDYCLEKYWFDEWLPNIFFEPLGEQGENENGDILAMDEMMPEKPMFGAPVVAVNYQGQQMGYRPWYRRPDPPPEFWQETLQQLDAHMNAQQDLAQQYDFDEAIEEMMDVHGPEVAEEVADAIRQELGDVDVRWYPEGTLYAPLGPLLRQIPGGRMEAFLPLPAGPRIPVVGMMA